MQRIFQFFMMEAGENSHCLSHYRSKFNLDYAGVYFAKGTIIFGSIQ